VVPPSNVEAKYKVMASLVNFSAIKQSLKELKLYEIQQIRMYCDSQEPIHIASNSVSKLSDYRCFIKCSMVLHMNARYSNTSDNPYTHLIERGIMRGCGNFIIKENLKISYLLVANC